MYLFITPPQDYKWGQLRNKEKKGKHRRTGKIKKRQHSEQIKYNWLKHTHAHMKTIY